MKTKDAIKFFGSIAKLADAIGYSRQAIYLWGDNVPDLVSYKIEKVSFGKLLATPDRRQRRSAASPRSGVKSKAGGRKMAGRV